MSIPQIVYKKSKRRAKDPRVIAAAADVKIKHRDPRSYRSMCRLVIKMFESRIYSHLPKEVQDKIRGYLTKKFRADSTHTAPSEGFMKSCFGELSEIINKYYL